MKDELISGPRLRALHPKAISGFKNFIEECELAFGITLRISRGLSTFKQQDALYFQSRGGGKPWVTNARGGQSFHNYGLAEDLVVVNDDKTINWNFSYSKLEPIANKYGITWGGHFKDPDHFEMNFGHGSSGWGYFLALYKAGKLDANGYVIF